jgi:membrane-associated protein
MLAQFIHIVLHLDLYLQSFFLQYGLWIYALLFVIIFLESGVILTAFLPGDSLLFATGTIAAVSDLNIHILVILLIVAAIAGVLFNYALGAWIGPKIFNKPKTAWFNPEHIHRAHKFFERYGWGAIIITRFIPIIRTFIPFVAGIGRMDLKKFIFFNGLAALIWIGGILYLSYAFGQLPWIKAHFSWIVMAIIMVSLVPVVVTFIRPLLAKKRKQPHVVD